MNLEEAMAEIALEAERQGFRARQTEHGVWIINTDEGFHIIVQIRNANGLLAVLKSLIAAGLDWGRWDDPYEHRRD